MTRRARTRIRVAAALTLLGALLAGTGCTGGGDGDGKDKRALTRPKKLEPAWETRVPEASHSQGGTGWSADGIIARQQGTQLRGYDTRTGKKRWTLKPPEGTSGVCALSAGTNSAGLGGLMLATERNEDDCTYAGVVDLADGKVKWAKHVGRLSDIGPASLSIGDEALTVTRDCHGVGQYRPRDGKSLGTRLEQDEACAHQAVHNGRHLAVHYAPAAEARDVAPDWVPPGDSTQAHFALYEGADDKPVWHTEAGRGGDRMNGIVSDDPVVLDITREGHRLIQTYDAAGRPVRTFGKQLDGSSGVDGRQGGGPYVQGDTLVMDDRPGAGQSAYDLRTGKVRWRLPAGRAQALGVWKDRLLAVRRIQDTGGRSAAWLVTYGMRDGRERTVGRIAELSAGMPPAVAWDDKHLYVDRDSGDPDEATHLVAYRLPSSGGDTRRYTAEPMPSEDGIEVQKRGWRRSDVRPDAVSDACEATSTAALRAMRVYRKGMPPPLSCVWQEQFAPRHADRSLSVQVTAHQPGGDGQGGLSRKAGSRSPAPAVAVAEEAYRKIGSKADREDDASGEHWPLGAPSPLDGLGDEAKASVFGSADDKGSEALVAARHRNVVVKVRARTDAPVAYKRGEVPPRHRVEAAAELAAADVLAHLGADVSASARRLAKPAGGRTTEVEPACERLRGEAAGLLPGAKAQDTTPKGGADGRVTGCEWSTEADGSPSLAVRVSALPDSPLTGDDAQDVAESELAAEDGAKVSGLGDAARIDRDSFTFERTGDLHRRHELTVRKDNLVVHIDYGRWAHPSKSRMDSDVRRLARRLLGGAH
ncbi:PQQ-binding-like beta-propeller repeat protein [Streptomyces triticagri]|nr:PQQ-binding-like beta-propeller repeat protein [Streptomyces triticagri]